MLRAAVAEPDPVDLAALCSNLWNRGVAARVWPLALDDRERSLVLSRAAHNPATAAPRRSEWDRLLLARCSFLPHWVTRCSSGGLSTSSRSTCKGGSWRFWPD